MGSFSAGDPGTCETAIVSQERETFSSRFSFGEAAFSFLREELKTAPSSAQGMMGGVYDGLVL